MNSVAGLLGLLEEEDATLQAYALKKVLEVLDEHWAEVADVLDKIEALSEDETFPHQELAAIVSSKCFYHLEEYDDALRLALASGSHFDVGATDQFAVTMVGKCIERYIALRSEDATVDPKLESVVEDMFEKCYALGSFRQALGIALEAHRLDKVEAAIVRSGDAVPEMLSHCMHVSQRVVTSRAFRREVFTVLVRLYEGLRDECDFVELASCLHYLGEADKHAALLTRLVAAPGDSYLTAYQIAFDLTELQDQRFVAELLSALPAEGAEVPGSSDPEKAPRIMATVREILGEGVSTAMYLDFLYRNNKTDALGLKQLKQAVEQGRKNSVLHGASIVAHGYLQAGTTVSSFVRNNKEWLGQATNWGKFSATASMGVIHKGNVKSSMTLLQDYLPANGGGGNNSQSPYSEGGALYALGLIHAGGGASNADGSAALEYLSAALEGAAAQDNETAREALQHGACLGIGLTAMASGDAALVERLQNVVYNDNAVAGEAAALALGMVMLGGGSAHATAVEDMLGYAHDTQHEKIIRGLSLAAAMVMYGQEEAADALVEQLCRDKDPLLRYGGMYTVGLAYAGTANNAAIRRLLHVAVSDVANDVRRAAVTALGFLMLNVPERLPELIALLSESYNPHVRYGACMALAIGCSHMDDPGEALALLEHLVEDKVDFVKQGALIASAALLMQQSPEHSARAKAVRGKLAETMADAKHSPTMARMGAILGTGIIDAGGRNVRLELISRTGFTKAPAVVGMVLFAQYWFWYPMAHMLSLALAPTALIGVNKQLDMPTAFSVDCLEDLRLFDYPAPLTEKKEKKQARVKTAVLSMTAKAKARDALRRKESGIAPMDTDDKEEAEAEEGAAGKKPKSKKEPVTRLTNPLRVTLPQSKFIRFKTDAAQRYAPVYADAAHPIGVFVLRDNKPGAAEDVVKVAVPPSGAAAEEQEDPDAPGGPPEPFEWTEPGV